MNNKRVPLWALALAFLCIPSAMSAEGKELTFFLADGKEVEGELLSVRSGSFMVARHAGRLESELRQFPDIVMELPRDQVVMVEFPGRSNVLLGIGLGCIAGGILGGALSSAGEPDNLGEAIAEPLAVGAGIMVGAVAGIGVGAIVGLATSSDDHVVDIGSMQDLEYFRQFARYRNEEPDYLSGISR
jgi:hypothetical protein